MPVEPDEIIDSHMHVTVQVEKRWTPCIRGIRARWTLLCPFLCGLCFFAGKVSRLTSVEVLFYQHYFACVRKRGTMFLDDRCIGIKRTTRRLRISSFCVRFVSLFAFSLHC